jgi:hypothetical protein
VRSRDAGRSWDASFTPYRDRAAGEHGFVAFAPHDAVRMGVLFLDGRETKRMAGETPRVKLAFSDDAGASWGSPQVVDDGRPIGRVDVALTDASGMAVVSWLEQTGAGASIRPRRVGAGPASASVSLAGTSAARSSGFPRIALAGGELVVAWRDASEPARLQSALVELP